jgi:hypothetical protein
VVLGIVSGHHAAAAVCRVVDLLVCAIIVVHASWTVQRRLTKNFFLEKLSFEQNIPLNVTAVVGKYAA